MWNPLAVLAMALALGACGALQPGPKPPGAEPPTAPPPSVPPVPPAPEPSGDLCARAYRHMKDLGCPPPEPTGGGTWVDVCHNANAAAISMHERCILRISVDPTCTVTQAARQTGCERQ